MIQKSVRSPTILDKLLFSIFFHKGFILLYIFFNPAPQDFFHQHESPPKKRNKPRGWDEFSAPQPDEIQHGNGNSWPQRSSDDLPSRELTNPTLGKGKIIIKIDVSGDIS